MHCSDVYINLREREGEKKKIEKREKEIEIRKKHK